MLSYPVSLLQEVDLTIGDVRKNETQRIEDNVVRMWSLNGADCYRGTPRKRKEGDRPSIALELFVLVTSGGS
jgi:hypothetical protein